MIGLLKKKIAQLESEQRHVKQQLEVVLGRQVVALAHGAFHIFDADKARKLERELLDNASAHRALTEVLALTDLGPTKDNVRDEVKARLGFDVFAIRERRIVTEADRYDLPVTPEEVYAMCDKLVELVREVVLLEGAATTLGAMARKGAKDGPRTIEITHLAAEGTVGCDRKVRCGDYREGESIAAESNDPFSALITCGACRRTGTPRVGPIKLLHQVRQAPDEVSCGYCNKPYREWKDTMDECPKHPERTAS